MTFESVAQRPSLGWEVLLQPLTANEFFLQTARAFQLRPIQVEADVTTAQRQRMSLPATAPACLHYSSSTASCYSCLTAFFINYSTDDRKTTFTLPVFPILAWHLLLRCQAHSWETFYKVIAWLSASFELVMKMKGWPSQINMLPETERNKQLFSFNICSVTGILWATELPSLGWPGEGISLTILFGRTFLLRNSQWIATLKMSETWKWTLVQATHTEVDFCFAHRVSEHAPRSPSVEHFYTVEHTFTCLREVAVEEKPSPLGRTWHNTKVLAASDRPLCFWYTLTQRCLCFWCRWHIASAQQQRGRVTAKPKAA